MSGSRKNLSLGAVTRDVVAVYRRHWLFLIVTAMVVLLPQSLADTFLNGLEVDRVHTFWDVATLLAIPITVVINLFGQALYTGFAAAAVVEWRAGQPIPKLAPLLRVLPLKRLVAVDIVLTLGSAFGLLLLVVPGLVFLAYYSFAPALIKIEHHGVWASMRRSAQLVQGEFWRVLALVVGTIIVTEGIVEAITTPLHGHAINALVGLVADGLIQPIEGLVVVITAIALLENRGELPPYREMAMVPPQAAEHA